LEPQIGRIKIGTAGIENFAVEENVYFESQEKIGKCEKMKETYELFCDVKRYLSY
jgi:hypothetical protein